VAVGGLFLSGYEFWMSEIIGERGLTLKLSSRSFARFWATWLLALISLGLLLACGDPTATTVPAKTTVAATAATTTTAIATTTAALTTTVAANTTTVATTTAAPTTTVAPTTAAAFPVEVKDDAGRSVKVAKTPLKIVSLAPSNTEILYALGLGDKVVGVDQYSNFPEEATKKEKVGGFSDTNIEKVVGLSPDLVLATSIHQKTIVPALEARNLTVVILQPKDLAGVAENMRMIGKLAGVRDKAETEAKNFQTKLDKVTAKLSGASQKASVFFDLGDLYTFAPGAFVNDMLVRAGGTNIVTDTSNPFPQLTNELVVAADPTVILTTAEPDDATALVDFSKRAGWDKLTAVKNKRVVALNPDVTNRPGPRAADGVELIARALYPDLFK